MGERTTGVQGEARKKIAERFQFSSSISYSRNLLMSKEVGLHELEENQSNA